MKHTIKKQKTKPKFKEVTFKDKAEYNDWLRRNGKFRIEFKDEGQVLLWWVIDAGGEVLLVNDQVWIWRGTIVDLESIEIGEQIRYLDSEGKKHFYDVVVEKITWLK